MTTMGRNSAGAWAPVLLSCFLALATGSAEAGETREEPAPRNVAILIFDGVQIIDYTGPYEVFGQARFKVFTVSEKGKTITTSMGMSVNPAYSFATSPEPDILVIPGGS